MPITPYLSGMSVHPETKRVMGVAFEMVCAALRLADRGDLADETIARRIIELAEAGEHNPDLLCERLFTEFRPQLSYSHHHATWRAIFRGEPPARPGVSAAWRSSSISRRNCISRMGGSSATSTTRRALRASRRLDRGSTSAMKSCTGWSTRRAEKRPTLQHIPL